MPRLVFGQAQLRGYWTLILLPLVLMIGCFRRRWNRIFDELLVGGANIGAITKRFMIITATSASGNVSLGSFLPRGVSAGIPREGHLKAPQPMQRQLALWR